MWTACTLTFVSFVSLLSTAARVIVVVIAPPRQTFNRLSKFGGGGDPRHIGPEQLL
jgi:hypothetical protein